MHADRMRRILMTSGWGLILVQGFHMFEHSLQQFQHFWGLFLINGQKNGLLGEFVDFEWLHFIFNYLLWGFLFTLLIVYIASPAFWFSTPRWMVYSFLASCTFQTYHALEHVIRMHIWVTTGQVDTRGIFGHIQFLETTPDTLIFGHWILNFIVYTTALPLVVYTVMGRFAKTPLVPLRRTDEIDDVRAPATVATVAPRTPIRMAATAAPTGIAAAARSPAPPHVVRATRR